MAARIAVVLVFFGFALLGFVDDTIGNGLHRGFRGHVRALTNGTLTTGALKMLGGFAIAIIGVSIAGLAGWRAVDTTPGA